jgi:hypothetical protein
MTWIFFSHEIIFLLKDGSQRDCKAHILDEMIGLQPASKPRWRHILAGTYSQIYIQVVFAVKGRQNLLHKDWREEVSKYMCGIITDKGHKPIIVNGVENHVHALLG